MYRRLLIIDDSDPDLLYTQIVVERARIAAAVTALGSGPEALDYLATPEGREVGLVLLDINMPEMDGFAFLEACGHEASGSDDRRAIVVMLTSSPDPADRERAMRFAQVKGYVVKPLQLDAARELLALLRPDSP